jgi:hypothetical protein
MADRIGVIARGRLTRKGTLEELRRQAGNGSSSLEDTFRPRRRAGCRGVSRPGTLVWFAQHEFRLAWRDWLSMVTAGGRTRARTVAIALLVFAAVMHVIAYGMVSRYADLAIDPDKTALAVITGSAAGAVADAVAGDGIGDARLLHALRPRSPALLPAQTPKIFAVRIATIALSSWLWPGCSPVPSSTCWRSKAAPIARRLRRRRRHGCDRGGARSRADHRAVPHHRPQTHAAGRPDRRGRDRRRFVIGLQLAAIASNGTLSRYAVLASEPILAVAPDAGSFIWWPARAMLGDGLALGALISASFLMLGATIAMVSPYFAGCAIAAAGAASSRRLRPVAGFRRASPIEMLRRKEWALLRRDPWLVSQTLMQMLYLLPPAFCCSVAQFREPQREASCWWCRSGRWRPGSLPAGSRLLVRWLPARTALDRDRHGAAHGAMVDRDAKIEAVMGCISADTVFAPFTRAGWRWSTLFRRRRRRVRHRRGCGFGDRHSALLSRPGEAKLVSLPADLVAHCELSAEGVLVHCLGGAAAPRRCRSLDCGWSLRSSRRHPPRARLMPSEASSPHARTRRHDAYQLRPRGLWLCVRASPTRLRAGGPVSCSRSGRCAHRKRPSHRIAMASRPATQTGARRRIHDRLAGLAEIRLVLLEAGDNARDVRDFRAAQAERIRRAGGALLGGADGEARGREGGQRQRENHRARSQFVNPCHDALLFRHVAADFVNCQNALAAGEFTTAWQGLLDSACSA